MNWQLQVAKNRLSEVVKRARSEGPQTVTVRGERAAIILSPADYDALTAGKPTLVEHLLSGPPWDDELVDAIGARAKSPSRAADF